jgi:flagellin
MTSLLTNSSAMTALQTLSQTNKNMETTQGRISTGLRVSTASDNAAYWSIATTMRSDNQAISTVQDALGLGAGKVDTAYTAVSDTVDRVTELKQKVLAAKNASAEDKVKLQSEISVIQSHLKDTVGNAQYAGSNLIQTDSTADATTFNIVSSYNRDSTGAVTTGSIDVTLANIRLIDSDAGGAATGILDKEFTTTGEGAVADISILTLDVTATDVDNDDLDDMLTAIETGLSSLATGAAELGAAKKRIDLQQTFMTKLSDAIERGVGQLVDADMNEESARLQALQVQQQLGIQALSIANSNSQNILSLFR